MGRKLFKPRRRANSLDDAAEDAIKKQSKNDVDSFALSNIGVHLLFEEICSEVSREVCEFIIKANFTLSSRNTLTLMINTPGGSVYDGWGIVDVMDCSRLKIQTVGVGAIFSMGTVIFTAGTPGYRVMTRNSYMMTHQFSDVMEAKYHEFIAARPHQDQLHARFIKHFVTRTKMTEQEVNDVLLGKSDVYLSAEECLKYGICDMVKDPWE